MNTIADLRTKLGELTDRANAIQSKADTDTHYDNTRDDGFRRAAHSRPGSAGAVRSAHRRTNTASGREADHGYGFHDVGGRAIRFAAATLASSF